MRNYETNAAIIEALIEFGNSLDSAEVYFKEEWDCYYFSLLGKCFGMLSDTFITLKGDPELNHAMVSQYASVRQGYHVNKRHWISVDIVNDEIGVDEIKTLIQSSYVLVFDKLSNRERLMIADANEKKQGPSF